MKSKQLVSKKLIAILASLLLLLNIIVPAGLVEASVMDEEVNDQNEKESDIDPITFNNEQVLAEHGITEQPKPENKTSREKSWLMGKQERGPPKQVTLRVETHERTILEPTELNVSTFDLKEYINGNNNGNSLIPETPRAIHAIIQGLEDGAGLDLKDDAVFGLGSSGNYIQHIDGDGEFTAGPMSGWMYFIDNAYVPVGVAAHEIADGENIVLYLTENFLDNTYSWFEEEAYSIDAGEDLKLNLTGVNFDEVDPVEGATIQIDDVDQTDLVTDIDGNVTVNFEEPGTYHVSANRLNGSGERNIVRPYATVEVKPSLPTETELADLLTDSVDSAIGYAENRFPDYTGSYIGSHSDYWIFSALWGAGLKDLENDFTWKSDVKPSASHTFWEQKLSEKNGTSNEDAGTIIGSVILDQSPYDFGTQNVVADLEAKQKENGSFFTIWGEPWAMIALELVDSQVYEKDKHINHILGLQNAAGMFGGADSTGWMLTALAPYTETHPAVKQAIDKSINHIHNTYKETGKLPGMQWGENSNSVTSMHMGLAANGEKLLSDKWTNDKNIIQAFIEAYQFENGSFAWQAGSTSGALGMSTEQVILSLATVREQESIFTQLKAAKNITNNVALKERVKEAKELDTTNKTEESITALDNAIIDAEIVLADKSATQAVIDTNITELQAAIDNLIENKSNNAALESLTITPGIGEVELKDGVTKYDYIVDNDVDEILITGLLEDEKGSIRIDYKDAINNEAYSYNLKEGRNAINITTIAEDGTTRNTITLNISKKISQTATRIKEFLPAPGQFVNQSSWGSNPESILNGGTGVSLGSFGGYVTFEFDEPIVNNPDNAYGVEMIIYGNSFKGNEEPAGVQVMDESGNWYDIAGSEHYEDETIRDYQVTYTNPDPTYENGAVDIPYQDNQGVSGIVKSNSFHKQPWFPNPSVYNTDSFSISNEVLTYSGVKLNTRAPAFGYADVYPNGQSNNQATNPYKSTQLGAPIDLAWAVDQDGQPAKVDKVKQVKVYTSVLMDAGAFGEVSAEVTKIRTTNPSSEIGQTKELDKITLAYGEGEKELTLKENEDVYDLTVDADAVTISAAGEAENLFINNESLAMNADSKEISLTEDEKTVRVIAQDNKDNPVIYYLNLKKGEEVPEVDKEALELLVTKAKELETEGKTDASITNLEAAIEAAELILVNEEATQFEVDATVEALGEAIGGLVEIPVDLSKLEAALETANNTDATNKTEETIAGLNKAIEAGESVLADDEVTQDEVNEAVKALNKAIDDLTEIPVNFNVLAAIIETAKDIDTINNTDESITVLTQAIEEAAIVYTNKGSTQGEVDAAIAALSGAIQDLVEIPVDLSKLESALETAKNTNTTNKTEESIARLDEAIEDGVAVFEDTASTQIAVDQAVKALNKAIKELTEIPEKSVDTAVLASALEKAKQADVTDKTDESVAVLEQAIDEAEVVLADTESTQADVDQAVKALNKAIKELEVNPEVPVVTIQSITELSPIEITYGANEKDIELPKEIELNFDDNTSVSVGVEWILKLRQGFDSTVPGVYTFIGLYELPNGVSGDKPEISLIVTVLENTVNKLELEGLIVSVENMNTEGKTEASFQNLLNAIQEAEKVINDDKATQKEVDQAIEDLEKAINKLENILVPTVTKDALVKLIKQVENKDLTMYTEETVRELQNVLGKVKVVVANANADQADVDAAEKDLEKAIANLIALDTVDPTDPTDPTDQEVNKEELISTIKAAEAIDTMDKTKESRQVLAAIIETGKGLLTNKASTQQAIDQAILDIEKAISRLVDNLVSLYIESIESINSLTVPFGTKEADLELPKELALILSDQTKDKTEVKWSVELDNKFNSEAPGKYIFIGSYDLPEGVVGDKQVVTVSVTVLEKIIEVPEGEDETEVPKEEDETEVPKEEDETEVPKEEDETEVPKEEDETEVPKEEDEIEVPKEEDEIEVPEEKDEIELSEEKNEIKVTEETTEIKEIEKTKVHGASKETVKTADSEIEETLPSTATNYYTILFIGFILLIFGAAFLIKTRKTN